MRVPWPVLALRSVRRSPRRRARGPRTGLRSGGAGPVGVPRPGRVRLRHARRAARSHGHHARDRPAALRHPAPGAEEGPHRPVGRAGAVGRLVGLVVRDLARSGAAALPPGGARPARDGQVGRPELSQPAAAALAGRLHAAGDGQLRQPHRAAARLLHDGRHRPRHRCAAPGAGRGQDRAHGDLLRHQRGPAVRARLPRARRPADPRLDRRARRPRRLPARHLPQPAARARRAVRARRVSQRDEGPGGRRRARSCGGSTRAARCAATSTTRTGASAPRSTPRPTSSPSCSSRAT